jgi:two-component system response regulator DevR
MSGDAPTVFLVDDHEIVRQGLRHVLTEAGMTVVGEADSAQDAVRRILAVNPDVVVLDVQLPDGTGVEVCREVRSTRETQVFLILTSFEDDDALIAAVIAGAAGYLLKNTPGSDLVESVRAAAAGILLMDTGVLEKVLSRMRAEPKQDPLLSVLTEQEHRVLHLVAEGLTNRQIGTRLHLAEKTIKNHVSGILAKLGLRSRTQAALFFTDQQNQSTLAQLRRGSAPERPGPRQ